uniref:Uncharacterized protein n=1 Tax=Sphaerodactylus townsendi TaxID=933632 RepID=A0ACB8E500_9SAUR
MIVVVSLLVALAPEDTSYFKPCSEKRCQISNAPSQTSRGAFVSGIRQFCEDSCSLVKIHHELFLGLLCFLIGAVVILMHYVRPELLRAFFDLCEDEEEDEENLVDVYINPHVTETKTVSSQPSFKLTIKNS